MFKIKKCPTTPNRPARHCKVDILAPKIHFSRIELLLGTWGLQGSWGSSVHRTASNSLPSQPLPCNTAHPRSHVGFLHTGASLSGTPGPEPQGHEQGPRARALGVWVRGGRGGS